ncbi:MAG TPA: hypothetical protein VGQ17_08960 [Gemmatimonadales bacterium]|nr:hypothetical protein [Gemmatimonadales bacterium]
MHGSTQLVMGGLRGAFCRGKWQATVVALAALGGCGRDADLTADFATLSTGNLIVLVSGLPAGAPAAISLTSSTGVVAEVIESDTLSTLPPGTYYLTVAQVVTGLGDLYRPGFTTKKISLRAGQTVKVSVGYSLNSGRLQITASGLPDGAAGWVTVTGSGYSHVTTASETLYGLSSGNFLVTAAGVTVEGEGYLATPASRTVKVSISLTPALAGVSYAPQSGGLAVTISGLPSGVSGSVSVTGPNGFSRLVTASQTLSGLAAGTYTASAASVTANGTTWVPSPGSQSVSLTVGAMASAGVAYSATTGGLAVTIAGLPVGTSGDLTVTAPGGFSQTLTASQTLSGLSPGTYTITATGVTGGGTTYTPAPASQSATVSASATAAATVTYTGSAGGATLNLTVNGLYLTQATQRYDGSVPLVAGRNAYLRVFVLANQPNAAPPQVRVRLYSGSTLVQTSTLGAPGASVPTVVTEGVLGSSWNLPVPGALVQPGLRVLADVDPAGGIAEANEGDNQFPLSGSPLAVDVRSLPTYRVRFVPVRQQVNGLQGNVTSSNTEAYLADAKAMLPVGAYAADVRAVYTTNAPVLTSDNSNGAWGTIISELYSLRLTDNFTGYYYGVVKTTYSSGVAGLGYVGGGANTALGWDAFPSASNVMAHEAGHNLSRPHAPCGGAGSPDPSYPYSGGVIGVWGLDLNTLTLQSPTSLGDLMGYCHPNWISDYNWKAMMDYRQTSTANLMAGGPPATGPGLLVWGRITPTGIVLEPSFQLTGITATAPTRGPHRLDLLAADGSVLRTVNFDADELADAPGGVERHFAFVLPFDASVQANLAAMRVEADGRSVTRDTRSAGGDPEMFISRPTPQQIELRWNGALYPMVLVRDQATGQVLSFARGGLARIWSSSAQLDLLFSDGVRSPVRQYRVLK